MPDRESKLCECGCGQPAPLATGTRPSRGEIKGQPKRFVHGHGTRTRPRRDCEVPGCPRKAHGQGLCDKHYQRQRKGLPLDPPTWLCKHGHDLRLPNALNKRGKCLLCARAQGRKDEQARRDRIGERLAREARDRRKEWSSEDWARHRAQSFRRRQQPTDVVSMLVYHVILAADPCCYCGAPATTADHIDPIARNGSGEWDNITAACMDCNRKKWAKPLLVYLATR